MTFSGKSGSANHGIKLAEISKTAIDKNFCLKKRPLSDGQKHQMGRPYPVEYIKQESPQTVGTQYPKLVDV